MPISPDDWSTLSDLLGQGLELPVEARSAWLDEVARQWPAHRAALERMLALEALDPSPAFLSTLPKIAVADEAAGADAGRLVGPYRLVREIGHGGMGTVWLAERVEGVIRRPVAVKVPRVDPGDAALIERFAREREIQAPLEHPNIVRIDDAGVTADGLHYLALEYVDGQPITAWCDARRLTVRHRIVLMMQVLSAVQHAHAHLVIHRDIKPGNILVTAEGQAKLLDFGIAKLLDEDSAASSQLTQQGMRAMTPGYASPEQIQGEPVTTASDIYSIGVLLYELLAGARPYRPVRDSRAALEAAIVSDVPVPPSIAVANRPDVASSRGTTPRALARQLRGDLDTIVLEALKKRPEQRYPTVQALRLDLQRALDGEPVSARRANALERLLAFTRRHALATVATAVVAVTLVAATGVSLWQVKVAREQARTAQAVQTFLEDLFKANSTAQPDPVKARQTTARELLDLGATKIDTELRDTPHARLRVLGTLVQIYDDLSLAPQVTALAQRRVALAREVLPAEDPELADALVQLAFAKQGEGDKKAGVAAAQEAVAILDARGDRSSLLRARAETALANADSRSAAENAALLGHVDRAIALLMPGPPRVELVNALQVRSNVLQERDDFDGSRRALQQALATAKAIGPAARVRLPDLYFTLARAQSSLADVAGADESYRQGLAAALANVSGPNLDTLVVMADFGGHLRETGRLAESVRVLADAARMAQALAASGVVVPRVAMTLRRQGLALTEYGRLEDGRAALEASARLWDRIAYSPRFRWGQLEREGENATEGGRYDDARRSLGDALRIQREIGDDRLPDADSGVLLRTALALAQADAGAASAALSGFVMPAGMPADGRLALRHQVAQAQVALAAGDAQNALGRASLVRARIAASPQRAYLAEPEADADLVAGHALRRLGRPAEARPLLEQALTLRRALYDPTLSPRIAQAEVALAACLADLRERDGARALAAQAQALVAANPRLGEQYVRPLRELTTRLQAAASP